MDFLDIVMELRKRYRVQIPEEDYPQLATMSSTVGVPRTADEGHPRTSESRYTPAIESSALALHPADEN